MEDLEIRESYYMHWGQHSRHKSQRLLQCLHQVTNIINVPPHYPGGNQW